MSDELGKSHNWYRILVSLALFVLGTLVIFLWFGASWSGLILTLVFVLSFSVVRHMGWLTRTGGDEDESVEPGTEECPHCGSMQTDYENRYDDRGREYEQLHCFSCDRDIEESNVE